MPIILFDDLFDTAKQLSSEKYFHARVVEEETFNTIINKANEYNLHNRLKNASKQEIKNIIDELDKDFKSIIANITFSMYVEYLIQKHVFEHKIPKKLTWALAVPADNEGKSAYIGFDVSRVPGKRNDLAVSFILFDPYGIMMNAVVQRITGEKLTGEEFRKLLISLLSVNLKQRGIDRLVIYKHGGIRSRDEYHDILTVFKKFGFKIGLKRLDLIGVIERHNLRLFAKKKYGNEYENPERGTWIRLWSIKRHGIEAERALLVSSEVKEKDYGTVKPIVLEQYNTGLHKPNLRDIVLEYYRLCRLDFWNPINGFSKLPLPLYMADKLAYLMAVKKVPIRIP